MDTRALDSKDIHVSHKNCSHDDYICKNQGYYCALTLNIYIKVDIFVNSDLFSFNSQTMLASYSRQICANACAPSPP